MIGIQTNWDDSEKTVLCMSIGDYWDWDDFHAAINAISAMMLEVTHQVDVVTLMRPTTALPDGSGRYIIRNALVRMPRNAGIHVMVGGNVLLNCTLRMIANSHACMTGRFFQTRSLGEAYRTIARNRPELYELMDSNVA